MATKAFLDANLLLDLMLKRAGFNEAKKVMQMCIDGAIELVTTPAVLHICSYFISKAYDRKTAKQLLTALLDHIEVIDCTHETALTALHSPIPDIEDALQYFAAIAHKVDYFISSDLALKKIALRQLPVGNAAEFLKSIG